MGSLPRSIELSTTRLRLRPLTIDDLDSVMAIESSESHRTFMGAYSDRESAQKSLLRAIDQLAERGYGLLGIELAGERSSSIIGYCGLLPAQTGEPDVEIVCSIMESEWGRGIATEASRAVLAWGAEIGFARVLGRVAEANGRSARLVARLGMKPIKMRTDQFTGHSETVFAVESNLNPH